MNQQPNVPLLEDLHEARATLYAFDPTLANNPILLASLLIAIELQSTMFELNRLNDNGLEIYEQIQSEN